MAFGALCMFMMHQARFSHEGKVCAGDFLTQNDPTTNLLVLRGRLMYGYIMVFWSLISIFFVTLVAVGLVFLRAMY